MRLDPLPLLTGVLARLRSLTKREELPKRRVLRYLHQTRTTTLPVLDVVSRGTIAVIVPCFGHAKYLPTMFDSLLRQSRPPDEVIFVLDGTRDDSQAILEPLADRASVHVGGRWKLLVNERNVGQAGSLNRGIGSASSDLILILNDDDYLMHDIVETMLRLFDEHRDVALIGAHSIHFRDDAQLTEAPKTIAENAAGGEVVLDVRHPADVLRYRNYNDLNMTHSGSCFLRVAWASVGGYLPDKQERLVPFSDRDFQLRVNALFPVAVSTKIPFSFWRDGSSVDHGRDT